MPDRRFAYATVIEWVSFRAASCAGDGGFDGHWAL